MLPKATHHAPKACIIPHFAKRNIICRARQHLPPVPSLPPARPSSNLQEAFPHVLGHLGGEEVGGGLGGMYAVLTNETLGI